MSPVWLNGAIVADGEARIAPDDRGFLLGDGAFETMRFESGAIRRWSRHRARLAGALGWLEIASPDFDAVEVAAADLCARQTLHTGVLRLTVSRGPHGGGLDAPAGAPGTVLLTARARAPAPAYVSLATIASARRAALESERFKLSAYAEPLAARRLARAVGADMGLMVSALDGSPVCADCANVVFVVGEALVTPPVSAGALPGTARAALIEAARTHGLSIAERVIRPDELVSAPAAFILNAVTGVVPVAQLDGRTLDPSHRLVRRAAQLEAAAV